MLIDFHTHAFPDKIASHAIEALIANIVKENGDIAYARAGHEGTLNALRASMKKSGVDISVVLPIATTVTQSNSINCFAAEINNTEGIFSFGSLHPLQENPEKELEKIKEFGLKGIKLHPEYQGFYINSPESLRILKYAEELELYVVLHAGRDLGMPEPVHCSPVLLADTLEHISGKYIIAAHMGGYLLWEDVLKYLVGSNIMLDTSFCLDQMPKDLAKSIIEKHSAEKILFASDSPWNEPSVILNALNALKLSKEDMDKITFKNACRILEV